MKLTTKLIKEMVEAALASHGDDSPDIQDDQRARELLGAFRDMLKPNERQIPGACGTFLRQLADLSDRETSAQAGNMPETNPDQLEEGRLSDLMTKLNQWANPGKYEDSGSDEFVEKRFDEAYQLLAAARSIISQFDKRMAGKILDVENNVMKMRDAHRPAAAGSDVVEESKFDALRPSPETCSGDRRGLRYHFKLGKCVDKTGAVKTPLRSELKESGTAPDGGKRVAASRKKCVDDGKWWDAKEVSKPGGIFKACKDKSEKPK
jgi:hypothetical protein